MEFTSDTDDSSSDDVKFVDDSSNQDRILRSRFAEKFRCLLVNFTISEANDLLESFLVFIRKGPKDSRKFTRVICNYLFAARKLISKEAVNESYYEYIRKIFVLYCVLELRLISGFEDDSMVAADILFKVLLLIQGSTTITVLDVLVDIDEHIHTKRSISIMKIVYGKHLTKILVGRPVELDDSNFIKYLILFRAWYHSEAMMAEKLKILQLFLSTIKPPPQLRTNPSYALLQMDDTNEEDFHKKLLLHPLPRNALVRALRDAEFMVCQDDISGDTSSFLDSTMQLDEPVVIKEEVDLSLDLPNEIIIVDDDDSAEMGYVLKLLERLDNIGRIEQQIAVLQNRIPKDTVDLLSSDSDSESDKTLRNVAAIEDVRFGDDDSIYQPEQEAITQSESAKRVHKTYPKWISPATQSPSILRRSEGCAAKWTLGTPKKVTFKDRLTTVYVFDSSHSFCGNDASRVFDSPRNYTVTGPHCNSPYGSPSIYTNPTPTSVPPSEIEPESDQMVGNGKSRKKKRRGVAKNKRTSIDDWMKRRKLVTADSIDSEAIGDVPVVQEKEIPLPRIDEPLAGNVNSDNVMDTLEIRSESVEDMISEESIEAAASSTAEAHQDPYKSSEFTKLKKSFKPTDQCSMKKKSVKKKTRLQLKIARDALALTNEYRMELGDCCVLLKRLKSNSLSQPTASNPKQIRKHENAGPAKPATEKGCIELKKSQLDRHSPETMTATVQSSSPLSDEVPPPEPLPTFPSEQITTNQSMEQILDATSTLHSPELTLASSSNDQTTFSNRQSKCTNDADDLTATSHYPPENSFASVVYSLKVLHGVPLSPDTTRRIMPHQDPWLSDGTTEEDYDSLADCDISSPMYYPQKDNRNAKGRICKRNSRKNLIVPIAIQSRNDAIWDLELNVPQDVDSEIGFDSENTILP